ncbi:MAG: methylated-DNA--[protein]-cysteine S-methyltransferase [Ancalomicrobiaceae bacterium]|nr:methylated-DNA--[protein]-cysteine S-methyltransferase [Ancalomicrobiaceae bacterium]
MTEPLYTFLASPIGRLVLVGDGERLSHLGLPQGKGCITPRDTWRRDDSAFGAARAQLRAYFAGQRRSFELALAPHGTGFQLAVWRELATIPFGGTISYGELARRIGRANASRAVGAANGANPIPIIVPCHRVVGSDGSLTGFGGGIEMKQWLLDLERTGAPGVPLQPG